MNIPQEIGQTTREMIGQFQGAPAMFSILLLNLALMGVLSWSAYKGSERWQATVEKVLTTCGPRAG
jgi:hypothetical protein